MRQAAPVRPEARNALQVFPLRAQCISSRARVGVDVSERRVLTDQGLQSETQGQMLDAVGSIAGVIMMVVIHGLLIFLGLAWGDAFVMITDSGLDSAEKER